MQTISKILLMMFISASIQGCQNMYKQNDNMLIGRGDLLGSQFEKEAGTLVKTQIGALAGTLDGEEIEKNLNEHDKQLIEKTSHQALDHSPPGKTVQWNNPNSSNHGSITPTKAFRSDGRYCREYMQEVIITGKKQKAYGKACRKPDENWEIIN